MSQAGITLRRWKWALAGQGRRMGLGLRRMVRWAAPSSYFRIDRFLFAPPDLRTSDPTMAADIYAGQFVFAGRMVNASGASPFDVSPPSEAWAEALYGFGWLRHLQATQSALARDNARALVSDFAARGRQGPALAVQPGVLTRRILSFLAQSPLLLDGADHSFYATFAAALRRDLKALRDAQHVSDDPSVRLNATLALTAAGLCIAGAERLERAFAPRLADLLDEQILPDGGHISRNPRVLIDLMLDLLPLNATYAARGVDPPRGLLSAIDRMAPHLKMLRHPDGSIALFNGMGASQVDALATIFASHDSGGRPATEAPYSGYQRLEAGASVLIVDCGGPPPFAASGAAMAGCLAFEFSHGPQRLIVNCGAPAQPVRDWPLAIRSSAAHSTTHLDETSSCRFLQRERATRVLSGPKQVTAARHMDTEGESLLLSHDGYGASHGVTVERRLTLDPSGLALSGVERLSAPPKGARGGEPGAPRAVTRFHVHPSVKAGVLPDGRLLLVPVRGPSWIFNAEGGTATIEDSVFFSGVDGVRRTQQILLSFADPAGPARWRLTRRDGAA